MAADSKTKEYYEKVYQPDYYVDQFEMTSLEKFPVTVSFHLVEVNNQ